MAASSIAHVHCFMHKGQEKVCFRWTRGAEDRPSDRTLVPMLGYVKDGAAVPPSGFHIGVQVRLTLPSGVEEVWWVVGLMWCERHYGDPMILVSRAPPPTAFGSAAEPKVYEYVRGIVLPNLEYMGMGAARVYYQHWHSGLGREQHTGERRVWERPPLHVWRPQLQRPQYIDLKHFPAGIKTFREPPGLEREPELHNTAASTSAAGAVAASSSSCALPAASTSAAGGGKKKSLELLDIENIDNAPASVRAAILGKMAPEDHIELAMANSIEYAVSAAQRPELHNTAASTSAAGAVAASGSSSALPAHVLMPFLDDDIELATAKSIEDALSAAAPRSDTLEEAQIDAVYHVSNIEASNALSAWMPLLDDDIELATAKSIEDALSAAAPRSDTLEEAQMDTVECAAQEGAT